MFRKSTLEERLGCLGFVAGGLGGMQISLLLFAQQATVAREANPDTVVCGLPAVAAMMFGLVIGSPLGAVLGMAASYFVPPLQSTKDPSEDDHRAPHGKP